MSRLLLITLSVFSISLGLQAKEKLVLTGSSTVAPLILEMAKRFEKINSDVRIDVQTGGSSRGVNDARKGLADIGMASRKLNQKETDLKAFTIALDGVGPIVHKDNAVTNLTDEQLKNIFTGKITNWKELGAHDAKIVVVNRAEGRSELKMFLKRYGIKASDVKASLIVGENAHGIKTVSRNKNAITYISVGHSLKEVELGVPIKLIGLNGIAATLENVAAGKFPFARPLNLVVSEAPQGIQKSFIDYTLSQDVRDLIESQSFVPTTN